MTTVMITFIAFIMCAFTVASENHLGLLQFRVNLSGLNTSDHAPDDNLDCGKAVLYAQQIGLKKHPTWYHGLTADSSKDQIKLFYVQRRMFGCEREWTPCTTKAMYAKWVGVQKDPSWYPGLNETSAVEDFRAFFARCGKHGCKEEAVAQCDATVQWAVERGLVETPSKFPGLNKSSTFDQVRSFLSREKHGSCHLISAGARICCRQVSLWSKAKGIQHHPDWYPGLSQNSELPEFKAYFAAQDLHGCRATNSSNSSEADKELNKLQEFEEWTSHKLEVVAQRLEQAEREVAEKLEEARELVAEELDKVEEIWDNAVDAVKSTLPGSKASSAVDDAEANVSKGNKTKETSFQNAMDDDVTAVMSKHAGNSTRKGNTSKTSYPIIPITPKDETDELGADWSGEIGENATSVSPLQSHNESKTARSDAFEEDNAATVMPKHRNTTPVSPQHSRTESKTIQSLGAEEDNGASVMTTQNNATSVTHPHSINESKSARPEDVGVENASSVMPKYRSDEPGPARSQHIGQDDATSPMPRHRHDEFGTHRSDESVDDDAEYDPSVAPKQKHNEFGSDRSDNVKPEYAAYATPTQNSDESQTNRSEKYEDKGPDDDTVMVPIDSVDKPGANRSQAVAETDADDTAFVMPINRSGKPLPNQSQAAAETDAQDAALVMPMNRSDKPPANQSQAVAETDADDAALVMPMNRSDKPPANQSQAVAETDADDAALVMPLNESHKPPTHRPQAAVETDADGDSFASHTSHEVGTNMPNRIETEGASSSTPKREDHVLGANLSQEAEEHRPDIVTRKKAGDESRNNQSRGHEEVDGAKPQLKTDKLGINRSKTVEELDSSSAISKQSHAKWAEIVNEYDVNTVMPKRSAASDDADPLNAADEAGASSTLPRRTRDEVRTNYSADLEDGPKQTAAVLPREKSDMLGSNWSDAIEKENTTSARQTLPGELQEDDAGSVLPQQGGSEPSAKRLGVFEADDSVGVMPKQRGNEHKTHRSEDEEPLASNETQVVDKVESKASSSPEGVNATRAMNNSEMELPKETEPDLGTVASPTLHKSGEVCLNLGGLYWDDKNHDVIVIQNRCDVVAELTVRGRRVKLNGKVQGPTLTVPKLRAQGEFFGDVDIVVFDDSGLWTKQRDGVKDCVDFGGKYTSDDGTEVKVIQAACDIIAEMQTNHEKVRRTGTVENTTLNIEGFHSFASFDVDGSIDFDVGVHWTRKELEATSPEDAVRQEAEVMPAVVEEPVPSETAPWPPNATAAQEQKATAAHMYFPEAGLTEPVEVGANQSVPAQPAKGLEEAPTDVHERSAKVTRSQKPTLGSSEFGAPKPQVVKSMVHEAVAVEDEAAEDEAVEDEAVEDQAVATAANEAEAEEKELQPEEAPPTHKGRSPQEAQVKIRTTTLAPMQSYPRKALDKLPPWDSGLREAAERARGPPVEQVEDRRPPKPHLQHAEADVDGPKVENTAHKLKPEDANTQKACDEFGGRYLDKFNRVVVVLQSGCDINADILGNSDQVSMAGTAEGDLLRIEGFASPGYLSARGIEFEDGGRWRRTQAATEGAAQSESNSAEGPSAKLVIVHEDEDGEEESEQIIRTKNFQSKVEERSQPFSADGLRDPAEAVPLKTLPIGILAPLTEDGYRMVVAARDDDEMSTFIHRVASATYVDLRSPHSGSDGAHQSVDDSLEAAGMKEWILSKAPWSLEEDKLVFKKCDPESKYVSGQTEWMTDHEFCMTFDCTLREDHIMQGIALARFDPECPTRTQYRLKIALVPGCYKWHVWQFDGAWHVWQEYCVKLAQAGMSCMEADYERRTDPECPVRYQYRLAAA